MVEDKNVSQLRICWEGNTGEGYAGLIFYISMLIVFFISWFPLASESLPPPEASSCSNLEYRGYTAFLTQLSITLVVMVMCHLCACVPVTVP